MNISSCVMVSGATTSLMAVIRVIKSIIVSSAEGVFESQEKNSVVSLEFTFM